MFGSETRPTAATAALFTFLVLTILSYDLSWSTLLWLFTAEIGPSLGLHTQQNTAVCCIAIATRYLLEIGVAFAVSYGINASGYLILVACLLINVLFAGVIWAFYPETTGRKLEDMDLYFAGAPRKLVVKDGQARRVWRQGRDDGGRRAQTEYASGVDGARWRWGGEHGMAQEMQTPGDRAPPAYGESMRTPGREESWK
jgi:hypothetical protein